MSELGRNRRECILTRNSPFNFDILCVTETFLKNDQTIKVEGYQCFRNNRKEINDRARKWSGGVACLIPGGGGRIKR